MSKQGNLIQCSSIEEGKRTLIGLVKALRDESRHPESEKFINNDCDFKFDEPYVLDDDDFEIGFMFKRIKAKLRLTKESPYLHHTIEKII